MISHYNSSIFALDELIKSNDEVADDVTDAGNIGGDVANVAPTGAPDVVAAADGSTLNEELELDTIVNAVASDAVNLLSKDMGIVEQLNADDTVISHADPALGEKPMDVKGDDNDEDKDSDGDNDEDADDAVTAKGDIKYDYLDDDDMNKGQQVNDPMKDASIDDFVLEETNIGTPDPPQEDATP
ncbi:hypothetical protein LINPERPRIM_LOCUS41226 [Linum perenne]